MIRRAYREPEKKHEIFSTSLADIDKALIRKKYTDLISKLSKVLLKHLELFSEVVADRLPPYYNGVDHKVNLLKDKKGRDLVIP